MNPLIVPLAISGIVITIIVIIVILALLAGIAIGMYNSLVRLRNQVEESWNQVDVELQRRHDLIPNLVETTKGYAGHERNTLEQVIALRNQAVQMGQGSQGGLPTPERAQVEDQLTSAVNKLLVTVEAYPDLKSNQNFMELSRALTETEDRIAAGRRYYNANVRAYNTKLESFPTNFIAGMGNFKKANYFEVTNAETRQASNVDFGTMSEVGPTISQQQAQRQGQGNSFGQSYGDAYPPAQPVDPGQKGPWGTGSANRDSQPSQQTFGQTQAIEPQGSYQPAPSFDQNAQSQPQTQVFSPAPQGGVSQPQQSFGQDAPQQPGQPQQPNQFDLPQNAQNPYGNQPNQQNPYGNQ